MHVLGYKRNNFTGTNGDEITGYNVYFTTYEQTGKDAGGVGCEKLYLTDKKLDGYTLHVGDVVDIMYTRQGKPATIRLVKKAD